jgi:hypothetical protein
LRTDDRLVSDTIRVVTTPTLMDNTDPDREP